LWQRWYNVSRHPSIPISYYPCYRLRPAARVNLRKLSRSQKLQRVSDGWGLHDLVAYFSGVI
jgi:hypothetical protein